MAHIVSAPPGTAPLAARLEAAGYTPGYPWMRFSRDADPDASAPTDLRLAVAGPRGASAFGAAVAGGFGMPAFMGQVAGGLVGRPGWTCLVAIDGDRVVAGGALLVDGDQGWLGMGAVLPEARGRGAQRALLAARVRLAAEAGCTTVTTETGVRERAGPRSATATSCAPASRSAT